MHADFPSSENPARRKYFNWCGMTETEFIEGLKTDFGKGFAERHAGFILDNGLYGVALELAFDPDPRLAFRGSYALEYAFVADPPGFEPYIPLFLQNFLTVSNPSALRHYTKMLGLMLKEGMVELTPEQRERVTEVTFDLLIGASVKVAVKVWAMEILFLLSGKGGWVEQQLYDTAEGLMAEGTPGIRAHCREIRRRLRTRCRAAGRELLW